MTARLLDLFCGAGGCSVGYARAGFAVTGVDSTFHESYPDPAHSLLGSPLDVELSFLQADALDVLADAAFLSTFDVVALSPPCPAYSSITPASSRARRPRLIEPCRALLRAWGGPYVLENVEGAAQALVDPVRFCGSSFGLRVRRHRLFESNVQLTGPACDHARQGTPLGVYGNGNKVATRYRPSTGTSRGTMATSLDEARAAMGIEWMDWDDLTDAIPPVYTETIGRQLLDVLALQEVAS